MKKCSKCGEIKELSEYGKNNMGKGGLNPSCKRCVSNYSRARYLKKNKELIERVRAIKSKKDDLLIIGKIECLKCGSIKDISQFYKRENKITGYTEQCKECLIEKSKNEYAKNNKYKIKKTKEREGLLLFGKKRCTSCKKIKTVGKFHKSKTNNKERIHSQCKECSNEKARIRSALWYKENKNTKLKIYKEKNKNRINEWSRLNQAKKMKDINYKLKCRLRIQLTRTLGIHSAKKDLSTMELVGCDIKFLKAHFSSLFYKKNGKTMSFNNYGEWHIDHKRPCADFDITDPIQQKICYHYSNLQPLWAEDNLQKSDKLDWVKS